MDNYTPRLKEMYVNTIVPKLKNDLSIKNDLALPKLVKVSLNMGLGEAVNDSKVIQLASDQLASIAGQQPLVTKARKSIATFKIRTGMPLGVKVTLRGNRMYEFIDRLVTIALPRIRDFRGLKKIVLMEEVITLSELRNAQFFLKLMLINLIRCVG